MTELVSIREASRRLGVSDTALHKALKVGRISVAEKTSSGRPMLDWEDTKQRFIATGDTSKRSHVGSRGSPRRDQSAAIIDLPTSSRMDAGLRECGRKEAAKAEPDHGPASGRGAAYEQSRAEREFYAAQNERLKYEREEGKLVDAEETKAEWFKHITAAKTRIMGIAATCKSRNADLPLATVALIEQICREALEDLANGSD